MGMEMIKVMFILYTIEILYKDRKYLRILFSYG